MMEVGNSTRPMSLSRTSIGRKSPTRLQSRAPAALSLDEITTSRNILESRLPSACVTVIPLLSPLLISPRPFEEAGQKWSPVVAGANVEIQKNGSVEQAAPDQSVAVIVPAASSLAEPSTLFAFFRAQCSLVQPTPIR